MNSKEYEHLFLELNSVLVKFWRANGRPDKELRIQLLERMLDWYKKMGTITQDLVKQELPASLDEAAELEKEAEAYWKAQGGGSHAQWDKFRAVVKHFTEWQKEHIIEGL